MPVLKAYAGGMSLGRPPRKNPMRKPPKRTECAGWTESATRRNTAFLMSVDAMKLTETGFAVTLTFRDCPPTYEEFKRIREAFFVRLRRLGLIRLHWVTEWTKRGLPHLHIAAYFPHGAAVLTRGKYGEPLIGAILNNWLELTAHLGTEYLGQHIAYIESGGWFEYMAKHASRGVKHYQRDANLPPGWTKTGRVWGHLGEWPTVSERYRLDDRSFFVMRRLVRSYITAKARAALHKHLQCDGYDVEEVKGRTFESNTRARLKTLVFARTILRCPGHKRSASKGISQWVPMHVNQRMIEHAKGLPYASLKTDVEWATLRQQMV